jgi:glycyl-tRNA synthetase beta chain
VSGELLLELLSEEIPARMQRRALEDLTGLIRNKLAAAEIPATTIRGYVTPRRLTVIAAGIPERQPDRREERRGPRVGAPPQALQGFLRAAGLTSIEQCEMRDTGRGEFYFAVIERAGAPTGLVLLSLLREALQELPWPKSMRYPASDLRWVRPVTSVLCIFNDAIIKVPLGGVPVGNTTRGHRFLSPSEITVDSTADYLDALERAHVVLDQDRRRDMIDRDLKERSAKVGLKVKDDPGLLDEVTGLVEYPVVLMGTIDRESMALPPEVLATAMRTHQKYFSCLNPDGSAAPRFLFVANNLTPDDGKTVIAGNERVLKARLADARFFWDQDRKIRLEDRVEALKDRVYHAKLGSVYDKVERVEKLSAFIAEQITAQSPVFSTKTAVMAGPDPAIHEGIASKEDVDARIKPGHEVEGLSRLAKRAAHLAKADLSTGMVGEFPELQGVMGRCYALHDREDRRVADAIADHYKPLGPNDTCPTAPVSIAVALADKIDTLAAFFSIGERPTGSGDPFALRRAAQGVIRTILENGWRVPLFAAFYQATGIRRLPTEYGQAVATELLSFVAERLKVHLRDSGVRHDLIAAAFEQVGVMGIARLGKYEDDLIRLIAKVDALKTFLDTEDGANLLVAYRRASNIVRIEEQRDKSHYGQEFEEELLTEPEERVLVGSLEKTSKEVSRFLEHEEFDNGMASLAVLRHPVDEFFDKVTVNTNEVINSSNGEKRSVRTNRLRLLTRIRNVMNQVADFSQIEG